MTRLNEMGEQRRLATLESLQQERPPQLIKIAIRLGPERFLEVQSTRESSIDLVRVHMLAEHDADVGHPRQFLDGAAHVVSHQKREICRTPISRQTKFDVDAIGGVHIGPRDEFERGDRLVQLRVGHCFQPPPDLGFTVGGDRVSHTAHSGAWTDSVRCAYPPGASIFFFCASMSMPYSRAALRPSIFFFVSSVRTDPVSF